MSQALELAILYPAMHRQVQALMRAEPCNLETVPFEELICVSSLNTKQTYSDRSQWLLLITLIIDSH